MKNMNKKTLAALSLVAIMATTSIGAFASTDSGNRGASNEKGTRTATMEKKTSDVKAENANHATINRTIARTTVGGIEHNLFMNHGTIQTKLVVENALLRDKAEHDKDMKNVKIAAMKETEKANRDASNTTKTSIKLSIKTLSKTLKGMTPDAAKFAWNDLKTKIELFSAPIVAKNVKIHTLQKTMKAEWVIFNTAVLANNEVAANASLTKIVDLKKVINAEYTDMTTLKLNLDKFLKDYTFPIMPVN